MSLPAQSAAGDRLPPDLRDARLWPTLEPPIPRASMPRHIAIIMDGNGRWAKRRGWLRVKGHEAGAEAVRDIVRYGGQIHLGALTLYAFSTENWKRPRREVQYLMRLLKKYLIEELAELHANGVKLTSIGDIAALPADVREELLFVQSVTAANTGLNLCLALNYGAQDELAEAARKLGERVREGELAAEAIDENAVEAALQTAGMAELDLLIRTAGERRLSNFLLWQACDAVFHVTETCWPDFRRDDLRTALDAYAAVPR